ncbi:O-succinylbenzoate synthase [Candidatus Planktophila dulcis]|uniref:O-succinylbenzoate synthase n=1 Tax=Candidatus Planktophila dulcis TaxID=1884914 RepID=A0AAC9YU94_9ACTN|nr:o-succinylbenzoate synthase [Candidatus Planktophila dulcis]ASY12488.1 O-succinylbenzoate synthase [Candidatus Planktophila dulcis]
MDQSLLETLRVVALPTKTNFRGITLREVALFKGEYGWGEFSPFLEYDYKESAPWLMCAIEAATKPSPKLYRTSVKVNGTIPALNNPADIERIVDSFPGVQTFKVKVGENLAEDIARLATVRSLRPKAKLRIDVNGNWSVQEAVTYLRAIYENIGALEYVEQPCGTVDELRELKEKLKVDIKIAGDEVLRKTSDPFAVDLNGAIDILMLKVQPLGGIARAHKLAEHHKLPVVISSALESAVGINYGLQLAASFPEMDFDCGLGTGSLLSANVADLPIVNGEIQITEVKPDFAGLEVAPERYEWWKNRVMKTAELL